MSLFYYFGGFPSLVTLLPPFFHPCVPFFFFCYLECFRLWSPFHPSFVTICHPLCLYFATLESVFLSSFFPNLATFVSFFCHPFFPILLPFEPLWSPFCHPRVLLLSPFVTIVSQMFYYPCIPLLRLLLWLSFCHPFVTFSPICTLYSC